MEPRMVETIWNGLWQGPSRALAALATRLLVLDPPRPRQRPEPEPQTLPTVDLAPGVEAEIAHSVERPALLQPLVERPEPFPGQARADYFVTELVRPGPSHQR